MPLFNNNAEREKQRAASQKAAYDRCMTAIAKLGPVIHDLYEEIEAKKHWTDDLPDLASDLEDLLARFGHGTFNETEELQETPLPENPPTVGNDPMVGKQIENGFGTYKIMGYDESQDAYDLMDLVTKSTFAIKREALAKNLARGVFSFVR